MGPVHGLAEEAGGVGLHPWQDVLVDGHGERGAAVAEAFADDLQDRCVFVGDCKYERATVEGIPNADLYHLLAYTTALDLPDGLLIYAAGEYPAGTHTVSDAGKRLHAVTLDLAGDPSKVLSEITRLADRIRRLTPPLAA